MRDYRVLLKQLGLSSKEAAVYLAALALGSASAQQIAGDSGVNRATTYLAIESLMDQGLMSSHLDGGKRLFSAESPKRLQSMLQVKKQRLAQQEGELDRVLPALMAMQSKEAGMPKVRYLEGEAGMQTAREIFLGLRGEFVQIVPYEEAHQHKTISRTQKEHLKLLEMEEVPHRVLLLVETPDRFTAPTLPNGIVRILSKQQFPLQAEITVRGDHVFFYSFVNKPLSVVLQSKEIATTVRALFDLAWGPV